MKKIFALIILSIATISCYKDYITDWAYNAIYFPYQIDVRTFIVGEGMKFYVGAELAGVRSNSLDRNVNFILNPALITPDILSQMKNSSYTHIKNASTTIANLLPLPANYYTLSDNSKIIIKQGSHVGKIEVKPDSALFLSNASTLVPTYVLPFYISSADADTILESKRFAIIGVKYENKLFGYYWHGGAAIVNRPGKPDTTIVYKTTIPVPDSKVWVLKTVGPNSLVTNGYLDQTTAKDEMKLTLNGTNVTISSATGSTFTVLPDGTSTFNNSKLLQDRKIFLKYSYLNTVNGYTYHATDTLTFRNRLHDGVDEWQDTDPSHYTK